MPRKGDLITIKWSPYRKDETDKCSVCRQVPSACTCNHIAGTMQGREGKQYIITGPDGRTYVGNLVAKGDPR